MELIEEKMTERVGGAMAESGGGKMEMMNRQAMVEKWNFICSKLN